MKPSNIDQSAEMLRALAHSARLRIVRGLMKNECNVAQIQEKLRLPQSTISQHLRTLRLAGIIRGRQEGSRRCYSVIDKNAAKIASMLLHD